MTGEELVRFVLTNREDIENENRRMYLHAQAILPNGTMLGWISNVEIDEDGNLIFTVDRRNSPPSEDDDG